MEYSSKLEWEYLKDEKNIQLNNFNKFISELKLKYAKNIQIKRQNNYNIKIKIIGDYDLEDITTIREVKQPFDIKIENSYNEHYLKNCFIEKYSFSNDTYEIILDVSEIQKINKNQKKEIKCLKEWYLNFTKNSFIYRKTTTFSSKKEFTKRRNIPLCANITNTENEIETTIRNALFIEVDEYKFIIQEVPKIFNPKWSTNIGIEYFDTEKLPDEETREKIRKILSFIFGRNLIKIGETAYDEEWNIIEEKSIRPNISDLTNLRNLCRRMDLNAIPLDYPRNYEIENNLNKLINCFLKNNIDLSHIIQLLINSMSLPVESEIIIIGSSLDKLTEIWFKSSLSTSKGKIINKRKFNSIMGNILNEIKEKFKDYPEIYRKIKNSHNLSGRKRVDLFLEELEINFGEVENEARKYRNFPAHGNEISEPDNEKLIYLTYAYRTFLNRILLKILNHSEYYDLISKQVLDIKNEIPENKYEEFLNEVNKVYGNDD